MAVTTDRKLVLHFNIEGSGDDGWCVVVTADGEEITRSPKVTKEAAHEGAKLAHQTVRQELLKLAPPAGGKVLP